MRLYREGLSRRLDPREGLTVLGEACSAQTALPLATSTLADIVVVDMATRDSLAIVRAINAAGE